MNGQEYSLQALLKERQKSKRISLRRLSQLTEIDVSTLSRIFSGKQRAKMKHLEKLSLVLEVSLDELLIAAGYQLGGSKSLRWEVTDKSYTKDEVIFEMCSAIESSSLAQQIEKELEDYGQYMELEEGKTMIVNNMDTKLKHVGQIGPVIDRIKELYNYFCRPDIALTTYILIGSGLLYFITAADVIPDFIFPLGFIDDTIAIKIIWNKIQTFL